MSKELYEEGRTLAAKKGKTLSEFIRELLLQAIFIANTNLDHFDPVPDNIRPLERREVITRWK
jgi:hypothetical protein